jgi:DNA polymerase III subunit epsilon
VSAKRLQRWWYRRSCRDQVIKRYYDAPWPRSSAHFSECRFLVVDLETTDLSAQQGEVASIGWVVIEQGVIQISSSEYYLVQLEKDVGQSAVYHHLHDQELAEARKITDIFKRFLEAAMGCVLVFHHAGLDMAFLNKLSHSIYGVSLCSIVVDTLELEKRKFIRQNQMVEQGALRLFNCRERYGLPVYPAHNAFVDALATAELLLAYAANQGVEPVLSDFI